MFVKAILGLLLAIGASYYIIDPILHNNGPQVVPKLPETNWGPAGVKEDTSIRPFKIDVPNDVIEDLKDRLSKTRELKPSLENTGWTYGISGNYLKTVLEYWRNKYNWYNRQDLLNKYPQFITRIQGLDIHFIHAKPTKTVHNGKTLRVLPLLLVHGWPGSFVEFQKIIPMLTTPRDNADFVFEVIAPSLPGYAFSQAAVRPGLGLPQIAVVFKNLMSRLGFQKFYTQAGDWGSAITSNMAVLFPERIFGGHLNMCLILGNKSFFWQLVGTIFPSLVVDPKYHSRMYPLKDHLSRLIRATGYFHIQATKPDTVGVGLNDSPAGLAAYILEKFGNRTKEEYILRDDGGMLEKYKLDELLDNIMIYWITNSIQTSVRLYAEVVSFENRGKFDEFQDSYRLLIDERSTEWTYRYEYTTNNQKLNNRLQSHVPTACAVFPHEIAYSSEKIVKLRYKNLIQFTHLPYGGHFAAFEEPEALAEDFWKFVKRVESMKS